MAVKPHENIRIKVVQLLRKLLKDIVEYRYKVRIIDYNTYNILLKLLDSEEIVILMRQEIYVNGTRMSVDMGLGSKIVFDFKSSEKEFDEAKRKAESDYWRVVSTADFFIITNWDKWKIYKVNKIEAKLEQEREFNVYEATVFLKTQVIPQLKEIKIPPLPQNVEILYKLDHKELLENLKNAFNIVKNEPGIKPLYEAYKSMMSMLYGDAEEIFFEDLFIRHTYMQIAVLASLTACLGDTGSVEDVCSGSLIKIDIALPYLNWWKIALYNDKDKAKSIIKKVLEEIVTRANIIDWSLNAAEDVFRTLYEFLVEPPVRRKLGEYYTPIWLVEMIINEFDVKEKIVLDPFCGSGTFLIKTFYKKINEGEDPEKALNEIVGFDINPLAISVARSELVIAYKRKTGKKPEYPPHIYHVDTLAIWFGGDVVHIKGFKEILSKARTYLETLLNFGQIKISSTSEILSILRILEKNLTYAIKFAFNECKLDVKRLEESIEDYLEQLLRSFENSFIQNFLQHFKKQAIARSIANLILNHGGNDVWAVVLVSIYASILMTRFKPDIIVTNPPWIPVTEYNAPYSSNIREYMLKKIKKRIKNKAGQIVTGADIASASLGKSVELVNEGVAFIMNKDQLFNYRFSTPAGIVASYCILEDILKNTRTRVKLFYFDFDVFGHGVHPAVIIIKGIKS
jgi:hypothetical protein